jgi:hypothetical protein
VTLPVAISNAANRVVVPPENKLKVGDPRRPRRFRITIEGVTRYIDASRTSADVTLTMPKRFRNSDGKTTDQIMLGGMPLAGVGALSGAERGRRRGRTRRPASCTDKGQTSAFFARLGWTGARAVICRRAADNRGTAVS